MNTPLDSTLGLIRGCSNETVRVTAETRGGTRVYVRMDRTTAAPTDFHEWFRVQRAASHEVMARVTGYRNTRDGFRGKGNNLYMLLDPR